MVLAAVSGMVTIGAVAKSLDPEIALSIRPINGFASQEMSARLTKIEIAKGRGKFPEQMDAQRHSLAIQAFMYEPATAEAVAVMALSQQIDRKRALMKQAYDLSRRQKLATAWMIADSGQQADANSILKYYDTILRTSSASNIVITVMVDALKDKELIKPFAAMLSTKPPWESLFWATVAGTPEAIGNAAQLRRVLYKPGESEDGYQDAELIKILTDYSQFDKAEGLYVLLSQPRTSTALIRNSEFRAEPKYPPMDWQLFSSGEYGATIADGKLIISAIPAAGGLFARQLVKLPNGMLSLQIKFAQKAPEKNSLFLEISCGENIPNNPSAIKLPLDKKFVSRMINNQASQCMFYWIDISGRAPENGDGLDVLMESVSIQSQN